MSIILLGLFIPLMILPLVLTVWALFDALNRPSSTWEASDQNQLLWVLAIIFVGLIGPVLYLLVARPKFGAVDRDGAHHPVSTA